MVVFIQILASWNAVNYLWRNVQLIIEISSSPHYPVLNSDCVFNKNSLWRFWINRISDLRSHDRPEFNTCLHFTVFSERFFLCTNNFIKPYLDGIWLRGNEKYMYLYSASQGSERSFFCQEPNLMFLQNSSFKMHSSVKTRVYTPTK